MAYQKKKAISIRLDQRMLNQMEVVCDVFMINRTALIERCIREFIANWWEREGEAIKDFEAYKDKLL